MDLCKPCQRIHLGSFSRSLPGLYRQYSIRDSDWLEFPVDFDGVDHDLNHQEHHRDFKELASCANRPNGCNLCKVFMWYYRKKGEGKGHGSLRIEVDSTNFLPGNRPGNIRMMVISLRFMGDPMDSFARVLISPQDVTDTTSVFEAHETNFGDSIHVDRARHWISECLHNHKTCNRISGHEKYLPARALNVTKSESLVFLETTMGKLGKYVALSYCWGQSKQIKLEGVDPLSRFAQGISVSTLPKTIQDAISVTRRLGFDYLWVDALCIIQDSKEDLNHEKARMDITYSDATVTLFVTNGVSADDGIFSRGYYPAECSIYVPPFPRNPDEETIMNTFNVRAQAFNTGERYGLALPWSLRGWTMQEYISAPRGIIYTDSQMGWFCLTYAKKGNVDWVDQEIERTRILDVMTSATKLNDNFEHVSHFWRAFIRSDVLDSLVMSRKQLQESITHQFYAIPNELSNRCFTYESDKLEAVASIAKTTELKLLKLGFAQIREGKVWKESANPPRYWAGLWDDDWAYGFFWKQESERSGHRNRKQWLTRPEGDPCVPSWSWASVLYSRHQSFPNYMRSTPVRHIKNVITPDLSNDQDRFIPTEPLPLRLTGPLLRLSEDWRTPRFLTETSYNVFTGFEARVRESCGISRDWSSFLKEESESDWLERWRSEGDWVERWRSHRLQRGDEKPWVILQVLSWDFAFLCWEEAFYLILERVQRPQGPGDGSVISETPERYRRVASLSQRGFLPLENAQDISRDLVEREENLAHTNASFTDLYRSEPTARECRIPSLLELTRRDPWPEMEIELV